MCAPIAQRSIATTLRWRAEKQHAGTPGADRRGQPETRTPASHPSSRIGIAVMLWTWPHLSNGVVEISNLATQVKIIAGALTETLMGGLMVVWLARLFAGVTRDAVRIS
jgi:hypothetical protein